jgi:hypothetical protein
MYHIFVFSFYSKLISVINDYGVGWEHTLLCFSTGILNLSCYSYNSFELCYSISETVLKSYNSKGVEQLHPSSDGM